MRGLHPHPKEPDSCLSLSISWPPGLGAGSPGASRSNDDDDLRALRPSANSPRPGPFPLVDPSQCCYGTPRLQMGKRRFRGIPGQAGTLPPPRAPSGLPGGGAGASDEATAPDPRVPRSSSGRGDRGREGSPAPLEPLHGVAAAGFRQPLLRGYPGAAEVRADRRSLPEQRVSAPERDGPGSEVEGGPARESGVRSPGDGERACPRVRVGGAALPALRLASPLHPSTCRTLSSQTRRAPALPALRARRGPLMPQEDELKPGTQPSGARCRWGGGSPGGSSGESLRGCALGFRTGMGSTGRLSTNAPTLKNPQRVRVVLGAHPAEAQHQSPV